MHSHHVALYQAVGTKRLTFYTREWHWSEASSIRPRTDKPADSAQKEEATHHDVPDGGGQGGVGGGAREAQELPEPRPPAAADAADPQHPVRVLQRRPQLLRLAHGEADLHQPRHSYETSPRGVRHNEAEALAPRALLMA